jgi:hypothetical protein
MDGTCACYVAANDMFGDYEGLEALPSTTVYGPHRFLLLGDNYGGGNDEWAGEVIVGRHTIIAMIVD